MLEFLPWAVLLLAAWLALGIVITKRPLGKTLIAIGDNARAVDYAGARRAWVTTRAFVLSSLSATLSAVLLVGYAGVHPSVGRGYEFTAITAVVLGGGRGWIVGAVAGAFAPEALFLLLNIAGVPSTLRDAVQGVIIIAAVAYAGVAFRARRRRGPQPTDVSTAGTENAENRTTASSPTTRGD